MRGRLAITVCLLFLGGAASPSYAQDADMPDIDMQWLSGKQLRQAFSGKTMDGIYKQPRARSGTNRFTESFYKNGETDYREGKVIDKGYWTVVDKLICFRYEGALAGNVSCFAVYRSGTCYYSFSPSDIGPNNRPRNPNLWSVKTIYQGDVSTCDDLIS